MTVEVGNLHLKYIKQQLLPEIVGKLNNEKLYTYEVEHSGGLDGFMSTLYNLKLQTKTDKNCVKKRVLTVKFMKGDEAFRESSKSYIQFANEIFIYSKVLPAYKKLLHAMNITKISVENWAPHVYAAKFGYIDGLSATPDARESVLVLENLKSYGYELGPRLYLNRDQLLRMCELLGKYHAMSYVLRLSDAPQLERLLNEIIPLPFINDNDPTDAQNNLYRVLYRLAFDRFFDFFDRKIDGNTFDQQNADDLKLIERLSNLREKYFAEPTRLLESIRTGVIDCEEDKHFGAILHGDFNRNNVLFRFANQEDCMDEGERKVDDVKMIDFQELRYGTPCIDLSFFMYMNTPDSLRDDIWMEILKNYHKHMYETLKKAVKLNKTISADQLDQYNFDNFYAHFSRYAFYGVMVCLHFLPWMLCPEDECAKLSHLFATDMHGEEFCTISIEAGGDEVNFVLLKILKHALDLFKRRITLQHEEVFWLLQHSQLK